MPRIEVTMNLKQIEDVIAKLRTEERISLMRRLERKTWGERFRSLAAKIDQRRRRYPISRKQVLQLIREAKKERYAAGRS